MKNNNYYNKHLKNLARKNRSNMTKAETKIWNELLRNKQFYGYKFLRQRPIKNYIIDFFCKELSLIIEIDGFSHEHKAVFENDIKRQKELETLGYHFLRFNDEEVMSDFDNIMRTMEIWLDNHKQNSTHLNPLPKQVRDRLSREETSPLEGRLRGVTTLPLDEKIKG